MPQTVWTDYGASNPDPQRLCSTLQVAPAQLLDTYQQIPVCRQVHSTNGGCAAEPVACAAQPPLLPTTDRTTMSTAPQIGGYFFSTNHRFPPRPCVTLPMDGMATNTRLSKARTVGFRARFISGEFQGSRRIFPLWVQKHSFKPQKVGCCWTRTCHIANQLGM
jgi:hypothetical protein